MTTGTESNTGLADFEPSRKGKVNSTGAKSFPESD